MKRIRALALATSLFSLSLTGLGADSGVLETAEQYARQQAKGISAQIQAKASPLDPRLQLAPCDAMQAFSPAGTRPIGSTTVGVRCLGPANWSILVPVKVSAMSNYVATSRQLSPGQPLQPGDLTVLSGDLAYLPSGVVTDMGDAVGKSLKFGLGGGQPLRKDILLTPYLIQQGQDVKLIIIGNGFSIATDGKAMSNASEGQTVQVKTANGSLISGIAKAAGRVEARN